MVSAQTGLMLKLSISVCSIALRLIPCRTIQEEDDFEFGFRYTEIDHNDFSVGRPLRCNTNKYFLHAFHLLR